MNIGVGIFLLVLGAILAFAVHAQLGWLNLNVAGWVLMLAGLAEIVITLAVWNRRRHTSSITQREIYRDDQPVTVTERQSINDASIPPETGPGGSSRAPEPGRHTHI